MREARKIILLCALMPSFTVWTSALAADNTAPATEDVKKEEVSADNMKEAFLKLRQERDQLQSQFEAVKAKESEYLAAMAAKEQLAKDKIALEANNKDLLANLNALTSDLQTKIEQEAQLQKSLDEKTAELMTTKAELDQLKTQLAAIETAKQKQIAKAKQNYVVKKGDTITKIAKKLCKNGSNDWASIKKANAQTLGSKDVIEVGMSLTLPENCQP